VESASGGAVEDDGVDRATSGGIDEVTRTVVSAALRDNTAIIQARLEGDFRQPGRTAPPLLRRRQQDLRARHLP
jgi:phage gp36-like protein